MTVIRYILCILVFLMLIESASATTYYVAKTGSNSNNGLTEGTAWLTISYAVSTSSPVTAGDTIIVKSGTYYEQVVFQKSGTSGNNITLQSQTYRGAVIDGNGVTISGWRRVGLVHMQDKSWIVVKNFEVRNSGKSGIAAWGNSNNIVIDNNYVYKAKNSGIILEGSYKDLHHVTVTNNEISYVGSGASSGDNNGDEHLAIIHTHDTNVGYNYIHDSPTSGAWEFQMGISIKQGNYNIDVHHNRIERTRNSGIYTDPWSQYDYPIRYNTHHIRIFSNYLGPGAFAGITVNDENDNGLQENIDIFNNIVENRNCFGISLAQWTYQPVAQNTGIIRNVNIYNNIIYRTNVSSACTPIELGNTGSPKRPSITGVQIKNNIIYDTTGIQPTIRNSDATNLTISHNLFYPIVTTQNAGTNYIVGNPRFINAPTNFHLQSISPAIDQGTSTLYYGTDYDGVTRPQPSGGLIDIGAYEFPQAGGVISPQLTSWLNNKTNDASTSITINISEAINFSAIIDQSVTWVWKVNAINQNNNLSYLNYVWQSPSTNLVDVYGYNSNGTTSTKTWTVSVVTQSQQQNQTPGMIFKYTFDNSNVNDISGNNNNATFNSGQFVSGKYGNAISFNGTSSSYSSIPNSVSIQSPNSTNAITIIGWYKLTVPPSQQAIDWVYPYSKSSGSLTRSFYGLFEKASNRTTSGFADGTHRSISPSNAFTSGIWYRFGYTYDKNAGANNMKVYLNGYPISYATYTANIPEYNTPLILGAFQAGSSYAYNGLVDELYGYNYSLSDTEFLNDYNSFQNASTEWKIGDSDGLSWSGYPLSGMTKSNQANVITVGSDYNTFEDLTGFSTYKDSGCTIISSSGRVWIKQSINSSMGCEIWRNYTFPSDNFGISFDVEYSQEDTNYGYLATITNAPMNNTSWPLSPIHASFTGNVHQYLGSVWNQTFDAEPNIQYNIGYAVDRTNQKYTIWKDNNQSYQAYYRTGQGTTLNTLGFWIFDIIGDYYIDNVRVWSSQVGTAKGWHDAGSGKIVKSISINVNPKQNSNYSVTYRQNASGTNISLASNLTDDAVINLPIQYSNIDVFVTVYASNALALEVISISGTDDVATQGIGQSSIVIGQGGTNWNLSSSGIDTIERGDHQISLQLNASDYLTWYDFLTNDTTSTVLWNVNRTTGLDCTLIGTSGNRYITDVNFVTADTDWADCSNSNVYDFTSQNFSVIMKLKPSSSQTSWGQIISRGIYQENGWYISVDASTTKTGILSVFSQSTTNKNTRSGEGTLTNGAWNTLTFARGGTVGYLYNESTEVPSYVTRDTMSNPTSNTNVLYIARDNGGVNDYVGNISGIWIFLRNISIIDISDINNTKRKTSGYRTVWTNSGTNREIYAADFNFSSIPVNTNYSVEYTQNGSASWVAIGTANSTANQSITLNTKYQNTDFRVWFYGNSTDSSILYSIRIYSQNTSQSYTPPDPIQLNNASYFDPHRVIFYWSTGSEGNSTDSFNKSITINSITTWFNGTLATSHITYTSSHQNVTFKGYAYNQSAGGTLSTGFITDTITTLNEPTTIINISSEYQVYEGESVPFDIDCTDSFDNDTCTFSTNATVGTFNQTTGAFNWTTVDGSANQTTIVYANDGYGSNVSQIINITILDSTPQTPTGLYHDTDSSNDTHMVQRWNKPATYPSPVGFRVNQNGTWYNDSIYDSITTALNPGQWSNITVYEYNSLTGAISSGASLDSQMPEQETISTGGGGGGGGISATPTPTVTTNTTNITATTTILPASLPIPKDMMVMGIALLGGLFTYKGATNGSVGRFKGGFVLLLGIVIIGFAMYLGGLL